MGWEKETIFPYKLNNHRLQVKKSKFVLFLCFFWWINRPKIWKERETRPESHTYLNLSWLGNYGAIKKAKVKGGHNENMRICFAASTRRVRYLHPWIPACNLISLALIFQFWWRMWLIRGRWCAYEWGTGIDRFVAFIFWTSLRYLLMIFMKSS